MLCRRLRRPLQRPTAKVCKTRMEYRGPNLSFVDERKDPKDAAKKYTTTWFDMFRVENGKIAEHWDPASKE